MSGTLTAERRSTSPRARSGPILVLALVGFVALAQLAGIVGIPFTDRATGGWYDQLDLPAFNPPSWVFAPVWTTLYVLIGVAAWLVWREPPSEGRRTALTWWCIQLVLNAAWTPLFFGAQLLWPAFIEIVVLLVAIVVTIVTGAPGSPRRRVADGAVPGVGVVRDGAQRHDRCDELSGGGQPIE